VPLEHPDQTASGHTDSAEPMAGRSSDHVRLVMLSRSLARYKAQARKRRLLTLLMVGLGISLIVHVGLMFYLNMLSRDLPAHSTTEIILQLASLPTEPLTELTQQDRADLPLDVHAVDDLLPLEVQDPTLTPIEAAADLDVSTRGATPVLGGSGRSTMKGGLGGSGAATTFFGVRSVGSRFAYIVDVSASMDVDRRWSAAVDELQRSIAQLPDHAQFALYLYSSSVASPRFQKGWNYAGRRMAVRIRQWLDDISPHGGTQPIPAFSESLSLEPRPDVIFFMTDGQIPPSTPRDVAAMVDRGTPVVINTIAFGNPDSQDLLRLIAQRTGGEYRYAKGSGGQP
jgi:hypothetical protein